jgi:hypothetical protein
MTAPVIAELRRLVPGLRLTIQTKVLRSFLETRYGRDFTHVPSITDFGLRMVSATEADLDASFADYQGLHGDWGRVVEAEAELLRAAKPDLVLSNVAYVTLAAAERAGIAAVALSSLDWAGIFQHYMGEREGAAAIHAQMMEAYLSAEMFIQVTPAMDMPYMRNRVRVGPVGRAGQPQADLVRARLGLGQGSQVGLIAFGGIDHPVDLAAWPLIPGWTWLSTLAIPPGRADLADWQGVGLGFSDLAASVDVVVTKPGYGTFVEAGLTGTPVLFTTRPHWPECPHLDDWLRAHSRALAIAPDRLVGPGLETQLQTLFSLPPQPLAQASGNLEAALMLAAILSA